MPRIINNSKTFTVIIQARIDSTRLPGKAMLSLNGKPLLAHVIDRAKAIKGAEKVVLATGNAAVNQPLIDLAHAMHINVYSGSDDNVLDRFYQAYKKYGGDFIIRATGDNPFMDPHYAEYTMDMALKHNADLCSLTNLPLGVAIEIIKGQALQVCFENSTLPHHFEHVTPYIKENSSLFNIIHEEIQFSKTLPPVRLTVDEVNDYYLAQHLYDALYDGSIFNLETIIDYLSKHPDLLTINQGVRQKTMKESAFSEK